MESPKLFPINMEEQYQYEAVAKSVDIIFLNRTDHNVIVHVKYVRRCRTSNSSVAKLFIFKWSCYNIL